MFQNRGPNERLTSPLILETAIGHRVHRGKHGAHREIPLKIIRMHYHLAGELKFGGTHSISISPRTPSELGGLCDEIELRNLGS